MTIASKTHDEAPGWQALVAEQVRQLRFGVVQIVVHMVFFLHMIIFDSEAGLAMTLGRTSLVTERGAEPLSKAPLDLVVN